MRFASVCISGNLTDEACFSYTTNIERYASAKTCRSPHSGSGRASPRDSTRFDAAIAQCLANCTPELCDANRIRVPMSAL